MAAMIVYSFAPKHYDTVKGLVTDISWPDTFEEWSESVRQNISKLKARGGAVEEVIIDPKQFTAYCLACGMDHSDAMLGAFAVLIAQKQSKGSA